jgi:Fur family transcriptional regulator, ferric uptake regulator
MKIEKHFQIAPANGMLEPEAILAAMTRAGYSNTRPRRAVIAAVCEVSGQASSSTLLALGRRHHRALGLVTVYRTLEILLALGMVRKLHSDGGCHTYAPAAHDHGHHIICQNCDRAVEFEGCDIADVVASAETQTGFQVRNHWLEMFGICPQCQAESTEPAA